MVISICAYIRAGIPFTWYIDVVRRGDGGDFFTLESHTEHWSGTDFWFLRFMVDALLLSGKKFTELKPILDFLST